MSRTISGDNKADFAFILYPMLLLYLMCYPVLLISDVYFVSVVLLIFSIHFASLICFDPAAAPDVFFYALSEFYRSSFLQFLEALSKLN